MGQENEEDPGWERPRRLFLEAQVAKSVSKLPSLPLPRTSPALKRTQRRKHNPLSDAILRRLFLFPVSSSGEVEYHT